MPAVSFVIPVLNEATTIADLLQALGTRYPGAERVVVDGGSSDDTAQRAEPLCDRLLHSEPGRARQMNTGARSARGDYLLFLHADCAPTVSADALVTALAAGPLWGFCPVRLSGEERVFALISWFINQRSRLTAVATGDQMIFVRREAFDAIGGFDDIPLMEDVALCKRLRRESSPCLLPSPVVSSSRRWRERGVARTVLHMWALRLAYVCGVAPARLHRSYYEPG